ncbi:MAG: 30S ribosomal protein S16 [Dehalococcoidia bacterium]|nr:30S ribosomal protein S16 [Dehalococcoidia bacterium]MYD28657.1 30S ribosomal protein S16 [Dehalococcoidia bacterium]
MLRIRLRRVGKRGQAYYRVVVADQRFPRDGRFLESLGAYDPHATPPKSDLNADRARHWLSKGAQPSEAAEKILRRAGILNGAAVADAPAAAEAEAETDAAAPAEAEAEASEEPSAESETEAEATDEAPAEASEGEAEPALAGEGTES